MLRRVSSSFLVSLSNSYFFLVTFNSYLCFKNDHCSDIVSKKHKTTGCLVVLGLIG